LANSDRSLLHRLESQVLQECNVAGLHMLDDFLRHFANRVVTENDRLMD